MKASSLAISGLLVTVMLLAGCDRDKPGNPLPPRKPPMPKTDAQGLMKKPVWNGSARPSMSYSV